MSLRACRCKRASACSCLRPDGSIQRTSCAGIDAASISTPQWFSEAYRVLINGELSAIRPLLHNGISQGTVAAEFDPVAPAAQAWATIAPLLGFSAVLVAALCLVTYFVVDRAHGRLRRSSQA